MEMPRKKQAKSPYEVHGRGSHSGSCSGGRMETEPCKCKEGGKGCKAPRRGQGSNGAEGREGLGGGGVQSARHLQGSWDAWGGARKPPDRGVGGSPRGEGRPRHSVKGKEMPLSGQDSLNPQ